jgi:hypothetical protein
MNFHLFAAIAVTILYLLLKEDINPIIRDKVFNLPPSEIKPVDEDYYNRIASLELRQKPELN